MNRTTQQKLERALEFRNEGMPYHKIAKRVGFSEAYVCRLLQKHCKDQITFVWGAKAVARREAAEIRKLDKLNNNEPGIEKIRRLREVGLTKRDIARALGCSYYRVTMLLAKHGDPNLRDYRKFTGVPGLETSVVEAYKRGDKYEVIEAEHNVNGEYVSRMARKAGLPYRADEESRTKSRLRVTEDQKQEIKRLHEAGLSWSRISRKLGVSYHVARRHGR